MSSAAEAADRPSIRAKSLRRSLLFLIGTVVHGQAATEFSLTFDDGPNPEVTPSVLEVLRRHAAKATFFVLTQHAFAHPDLIRRILEDGHEIGLHCDRHDRLPQLPPLVALRRMRAARRELAKLVGPVKLFRPPYGSQNLATYLFARTQGLEVVGWSQVADDWIEQSAESAAGRASKTLTGGDIVLLHDGLELEAGLPRPTAPDRARVADLILLEAARRGLRSVTVGALLTRAAPHRVRWFR